MAYDNNQKDFPVPTDKGSSKRESSEFLPKYYRTPVNQKFLNSTLDKMISSGTLEKISAYYGRKNTKSYKPDLGSFFRIFSKTSLPHKIIPATAEAAL